MDDSMEGSEDSDELLDAQLAHRQDLTLALRASPYDLILYLQRSLAYRELGYPDLAVFDAHLALTLVDEVENDSFEYHERAVAALKHHTTQHVPSISGLRPISGPGSAFVNGDGRHDNDPIQQLASLAKTRCFQNLALSLTLCGCWKSAFEICERGLTAAPGNEELLETRAYIEELARGRLGLDKFSFDGLPDQGVVRREVYPWNRYEPDRFSADFLESVNEELAKMAPKCEVRVAQLPVLLEAPSTTDSYNIVPTVNQLGLFAKEDIAPGESVLREYSLLTANNRLKESTCDACGSELPPLSEQSAAVACPECDDTVFCDDFCFRQAMQSYHPAVCGQPVDQIRRDPDPEEAADALHFLLLARALAMAAHQDIHPLEVREVKFIWGDFVPSRQNASDASPGAGPPPTWTLPFSYADHVERPLQLLEAMDIDIYATLERHDLWVINTLFAKFRGTASARKSHPSRPPDVAAVHPFWCLANHDCNPNVTWEWGGKMVLHAVRERIDGRPGGIASGDEILNHYCDIHMPVQRRREWAKGSLGGWCMCQRCRDEAAAG
jgi:hypothetical protein